MKNIFSIIREAQKILYCPVCKRRYDLSEIKLKGFLDNIYILQTQCAVGHQPIIMTIIVHNQQEKHENPAIDINIDKFLNSETNKQSVKNSPAITDNNIILLNKALDDFDGDFKKLWEHSN